MNQIVQFVENIKALDVVDIVVAICIIILFKVLSPSISYLIVKLFKFKASKRQIKESAFYNPLKVFFTILGVYLAVWILKEPLNISQGVMTVVNQIFEIISVLAFAKALAASFTMNSTLIKRTKRRWKKEIDDSMLEFGLKVLRAVIYIIALFIVLLILNINLGGLVAGLGIGGIIITLAAQDTAKNIFGGFVLLLDKPFNVGDWIETPNYQGTVEDITFRTTRIRNFENSIVNIPNSTIADVAIINWTKMEKRKYTLDLSFSFETTSEQMKQVSDKIKELLFINPKVLDDDIVVSFKKIEDDGLDLYIELFFNTTAYKDYLDAVDELNRAIIDVVHNLGLKLAYPSSKVFVQNN